MVERIERYRFRVRGPDGRELTSGLAELVLPAPLSLPQWSRDTLGPGEIARLSVAAPARDGESVLFHLELLRGVAWEAVNHASASVAGGACAVELPVPALPSAGGAPHRLRFRAVAADQTEVVSEEARVAPAATVAGRLLTATFGHARYREGGSAALRVEAQGLDGAELRLLLERDGKPCGELRAAMRDGLARASFELPRDRSRAPGAANPRLRFRAQCEAGELISGEVEIDPPEELRFPEWGGAVPGRGAAFAHGEAALMRVQAPGLDGRTVRFLVEQLRNNRWEPYASVTAPVREGAASAELRARNPGQGGRSAPLLPLRFRPELLPA